MEKYAQDFLKDSDIEQFKFEIWSLYPSTEHMPGLVRYLQKLKQDMEAPLEQVHLVCDIDYI